MTDDQLLDDADLAYMREEQTHTRPTACELRPRTGQVSDGRGGTTADMGDPEPIQARITRLVGRNYRQDVPQALADRYGISVLVRLHLDLAPVAKPGAVLTEVSTGKAYEVVSDGSVRDEWATVQIVWGVAQ